MDRTDRDFIDEMDLEAYQFLFELSDADKLILAKFANLPTIDDWEKMIRFHIGQPLPAWALLDNIHWQFAMDKYNGNEPFESISYDRFQEIFEESKVRNNGIPNMLEFNTLALIESLRIQSDGVIG